MRNANITWLTSNIATGGDLSHIPEYATEQVVDLLNQGVDVIIDCRAEWSDFGVWEDTPVEYHWLPTDDFRGHVVGAEHFKNAIDIAAGAFMQNKKVFVHCHMGVNRGPSTAMAILMVFRGLSAERAFDLIRKKRPIAGIAYAEEAAVAAWQDHGFSEEEIVPMRENFLRHVDMVYSREEREKVQHAIRQHHERDSHERKVVKRRA